MKFVETDSYKRRPALVLYQEHRNLVVAGITSNLLMEGISLTREEGFQFDSVLKLNYIMTVVSTSALQIFRLSMGKQEFVRDAIVSRLIVAE
ncbi:MAG: hypothetical protein ABIA93_04325 [Candidatus Woesearchaeota archaeon]